MKFVIVLALYLAIASARPQHSKGSIAPPGEEAVLLENAAPLEEQVALAPQGFVAVKTVTSLTNGEQIPVNAESLDVNGCVVGPAGERVCPHGTFGAGNDKATFRGNAGPHNTGSNGNAGPIDEAGRPVDPAAQTYLKQIEAYKIWEKQQEENNKHIIG